MINKKYSFQNYTNTLLINIPVKELNNTTITGSCFYQENEPNCIVFPYNIKGIIFDKCNLINVFIPENNTINPNCIIGNVKTQNDLEDWWIDELNNPIEPIRKDFLISIGKNIDPNNIPISYIRQEKILKYYWNKSYGHEQPFLPDNSWFSEIPIIIDSTTITTIIKRKKEIWENEFCNNDCKDFDTIPEKIYDNGQYVKLMGNKTIHIIEGSGILFKSQNKVIL